MSVSPSMHRNTTQHHIQFPLMNYTAYLEKDKFMYQDTTDAQLQSGISQTGLSTVTGPPFVLQNSTVHAQTRAQEL